MRRLKNAIKRLLGMPAPAPRRSNQALWSIGIYSGASPLLLTPDADFSSPVITREHVTDVPAGFVADPFLVRGPDSWCMFFEVLNRRNGRGEIGLATSQDLKSWKYDRIVLSEPFHLSYPHIFEWMGEYYMVPETHQTRTIRLYKADPFPGQWTLVHTLITGRVFADATLFRHDDRWWLFTETNPSLKHDTLRLYYADDLLGTWTEHPASPIVDGDPRTARPAGAIVPTAAGFIRMAQNCQPRYGTGVNAFEITELTTTSYAERPASATQIVTASGTGWNASRMHHVDAHRLESGRWIAAVDGAYEVTKADIMGWD
jgi:hypothetical protein